MTSFRGQSISQEHSIAHPLGAAAFVHPSGTMQLLVWGGGADETEVRTASRLVVGGAIGGSKEAGVFTDDIESVIAAVPVAGESVGESVPLVSVDEEAAAVTDDAKFVRASVPVAEESVVESVPGDNENL